MKDYATKIQKADEAANEAYARYQERRSRLRQVLAEAKEQHTGEEVAAMWGRSRQALYKIMNEGAS